MCLVCHFGLRLARPCNVFLGFANNVFQGPMLSQAEPPTSAVNVACITLPKLGRTWQIQADAEGNSEWAIVLTNGSHSDALIV